MVLAGYEDATHTGSWRRVSPGTAHHLLFLEQCGYTLGNVERRAAGLDPLPETDQGNADTADSRQGDAVTDAGLAEADDDCTKTAA